MRNPEARPELVRVTVLFAGMLVAFMGIVLWLWDLQVVNNQAFMSELNRQSVRRVRIPAWRGRIFDRAGVCLADNRPSYSIALYLEEMRQPGRLKRTIDKVEAVIGELSAQLGVPPQVNRAEIEKHVREQRLLPLLAFKDVGDAVVARWAEKLGDIPGVDLVIDPMRAYPLGAMAGHTIGYVGRGGQVDADETMRFDYQFAEKEMEGKAGLERVYDGVLQGTPGWELLRIDAFQFRHKIEEGATPRPGRDVLLTLDTRLQRLAEETLGREPGSLIISDPYTGEVFAMASEPRYDLNDFVPRITAQRWAELNRDERNPLLNRPVQQYYAPGSTFKMVVALAALTNNRSTPEVVHNCPGYIEVGGTRMHCAVHSGHGDLMLRGAIERSCNVYFFDLGRDTGWDFIYHMAESMGFGHRTGIELGPAVEKPGILPNDTWKRQNIGTRWTEGDTCNGSIGQGFVSVTPIQMAVAIGSIANGGKLMRPRLVAGVRDPVTGRVEPTQPEILNELGWPREALELVRGGMHDVINADHGTGRSARVAGVDYAAKTGTAQFGARGNNQYHAWMVAFAPFDHPKYVVTLVLDSSDAAGVSAAPRMKRVIEGLFPPGGTT
ncbi:MAG: penicillin-binding protein 2 [Kiritimatiellia bacterium]